MYVCMYVCIIYVMYVLINVKNRADLYDFVLISSNGIWHVRMLTRIPVCLVSPSSDSRVCMATE
jgi:hypothetical protein